MLSWGEACALGVVQGATEFLPVSSSGHLALTHHVMRPIPAAEMAAIDVSLHVGTLAAVVAYFRRDLLAMLRTTLRGEASWERWWVVLLGLGTLPAAVFGLTAREAVVASFGSLRVVGACFLVTGTLLWVAQRASRPAGREEGAMGLLDALVIGLFQAAALFPGVSRSGSTISGGMLCGVDRSVAAKFSFLLGIPAIVGAELSEARTLLTLGSADLGSVTLGALVAAGTGFAAIGTLMRLVRAERLHYFSLYLWPLGALVLGVGLAEGW